MFGISYDEADAVRLLQNDSDKSGIILTKANHCNFDVISKYVTDGGFPDQSFRLQTSAGDRLVCSWGKIAIKTQKCLSSLKLAYVNLKRGDPVV